MRERVSPARWRSPKHVHLGDVAVLELDQRAAPIRVRALVAGKLGPAELAGITREYLHKVMAGKQALTVPKL